MPFCLYDYLDPLSHTDICELYVHILLLFFMYYELVPLTCCGSELILKQ